MPCLLLSSALIFLLVSMRKNLCSNSSLLHYSIIFLYICIEYLLHQNNFLVFIHSTELFGSLDNINLWMKKLRCRQILNYILKWPHSVCDPDKIVIFSPSRITIWYVKYRIFTMLKCSLSCIIMHKMCKIFASHTTWRRYFQ